MLGRYLFVPIAMVMGACSAAPNPQDIPGTYAVTYAPPLLASATDNCDRLIPHAVLSLTDVREFQLSIDLVDDCSRAGGGTSVSEVHLVGFYSSQGAQVVFAPMTSTASFNGTWEGDFVRLVLPPELGIAIIDVHLRLGPRVVPG